MNFRKIRTLSTEPFSEIITDSNFATIEGVDKRTRIWVSVHYFIGGGKTMKFARRPFAGATRVTFKLGTVMSSDVFIGKVNPEDASEKFRNSDFCKDNDVWLCKSKTQNILGVGKRTKKFSIWYKRA